MREHKNRIVDLTAAVVMLAATAHAGDLYTIRTADRMLRRFDTNTKTFTNIGRLDALFDFGGMSWDPNTKQMYLVQGLTGTGLYTVDLATGATTLVGDHGVTGMFGLAFDTSTDTMYATRSTMGNGFYSMDLTDGTASLIGDPRTWFDGLTYDPVRDMLVGGNAGSGDLYSIDRATGVCTRIYNGGYFDNCGLAWDEDTGLYWMVDWGGYLYSFDPENGFARTIVLSGLGAHDGFAAGEVVSCLTLEVDELVAKGSADFIVSGAVDGEVIAIFYSLRLGRTVFKHQFGFCATFGLRGVKESKLVGQGKISNGSYVKRIGFVPNIPGLTVHFQAAQKRTCPYECMSTVVSRVIQN